MRVPGQIEAVIFDMDGVLVDTEHLWDEVREELTGEWGGRYTPEAQQAMMGMSSHEWSRYLHDDIPVVGESGHRAVAAGATLALQHPGRRNRQRVLPDDGKPAVERPAVL